MNRLMKLIALAATSAALALTGCSGDGGSPLAPDAEPTMNLRTTVTVSSVQVIKDGDGIEGQGEFYFWRKVGGTGFGWTRNLSTGESDVVDWTTTMLQRDYTGQGYPFDITFRCTEYDQNIAGDTYPDSDMNDREATAHYVQSPDLQETNYITLGNDRCRVRMHYTITSSLEEAR